jgi:hypothetical protein
MYSLIEYIYCIVLYMVLYIFMYSNVYSCCIFSTQALNVPYFIVHFHYFTRPTDFSRCIFSLHNHLMFHTVAYVLVTTQDLLISNRALYVVLKIIFSTQALNVVYLFLCFHYFTRPTDFSFSYRWYVFTMSQVLNETQRAVRALYIICVQTCKFT